MELPKRGAEMTNIMSSTGIVHRVGEGETILCNWSNFRGNTGVLPEDWHSTTLKVSCKNCLRLMGEYTSEPVKELLGRVPSVHFDNKLTGNGIHMWISAFVDETEKQRTVSLYLSTKDAFLLVVEILYRIIRRD